MKHQKLNRLRILSRWLDASFRIPYTNIRFGWDPIIGLIPGVGDFFTSLVSLFILAQGQRLGVSRWTLARMGSNIIIDAVVGSLPLVGDLFDVYWKANLRNVRILEKAAANPRQKNADRLFTIALLLLICAVVIGLVAGMVYVLVAVFQLLFNGLEGG